MERNSAAQRRSAEISEVAIGPCRAIRAMPHSSEGRRAPYPTNRGVFLLPWYIRNGSMMSAPANMNDADSTKDEP